MASGDRMLAVQSGGSHFLSDCGFLLFQKIPAQLPNDTNTTDTDIKNSWPIARRYICRILKLYILWCMICWPIDIYNWVQGNETIAQAVLFYLHSFFMSATITQLWIPASSGHSQFYRLAVLQSEIQNLDAAPFYRDPFYFGMYL